MIRSAHTDKHDNRIADERSALRGNRHVCLGLVSLSCAVLRTVSALSVQSLPRVLALESTVLLLLRVLVLRPEGAGGVDGADVGIDDAAAAAVGEVNVVGVIATAAIGDGVGDADAGVVDAAVAAAICAVEGVGTAVDRARISRAELSTPPVDMNPSSSTLDVLNLSSLDTGGGVGNQPGLLDEGEGEFIDIGLTWHDW